MRVEVQPAPEEVRPSMEDLLDAYLQELAGHREIPVGATTAGEYPYLSLYWKERDRYPFLLGCDGEVAGFALVRRVVEPGSGGAPSTMQMAEFYIAPTHRRRGLGSEVLRQIWQRFPGPWELQVHANNEGGRRFWERCVAACAGPDWRVVEIAARDGRRLQFSFEAPPAR